MSAAEVGPGGGEVGPGGGGFGPPESTELPPGVITLAAPPPAPPIVDRALVGPAGGQVGPDGSQIGPGAGFALIVDPPSGVIELVGPTPIIAPPIPSGVISLVGGGEPVIPVETFDIIADVGGHVWFVDPRAIYHDGKTVIGSLSGAGHPYAIEWDHATRLASTPADLYTPPGTVFEVDDHDNPAFLRRTDGRWLTAYTTHVGDPYRNISVDPDDATSWEGPINLTSQIGARTGAAGYTYAKLARAPGDPDTILLFLRYHDDLGNAHLALSRSIDEGESWSARELLWRFTYSQFAEQADRIDFVFSDHPLYGPGDSPGHTSIYHAYLDASGWHQTDGTLIAGSLPYPTASATLVYDGTVAPARAWLWDIAVAGASSPVVVYLVQEEPFPTGPWRYDYARWTGSAWETHEVADAGGSIDPLATPEHGSTTYAGGIVLDHDDPTVVAYSSDADTGDHQIFRAQTLDDGATWSVVALTDDVRKNVRPVFVRNHDAALQLIWLADRYDDYNDYEQSIRGAGVIPLAAPPQAVLHQLFDISDKAAAEVHQLFGINGPPAASELHQFFDLVGLSGAALHQPFDLVGLSGAALHQPFDIRSTVVSEVQTIVSGGVITSYILTFAGQSTGTIVGTANAATVQAALEALSNLAPGDVVVTGGPLNTTDLVITFGGTYAGVDVPQITVVATGVVVDPPVGETTTNGGPSVTGGQPVRGIPQLWLPMMVFDKAGNYLGSLTQFNVPNPPVRYLRSLRVTNEGGMTFNVSRHSPEIDLIEDDRLVRLQSPQGEKPWWGTMSHQISARGVVEVVCKDPFTLLRDGDPIVLEEDVNDDTPATGVFAKIMGLHNDIRAATGEATWELDLAGSKPFRGDIDFDQDTLACLDTIITRSRTEIAWDSRLEGNRLVPILRVRDRFDVAGGADIFDGPDGNVTAGVQVIRDPQPLVFSIKLRGISTDLAKCLPEWAQWALKDVIPEVVVSVDPGAHRNRQQLTESMDWGLSKAAQAAMCNAIIDWLWGLYRTFLMAVHDIEGRPWHEGWAYVGPPDHYEPKSNGKDSLSRRAWTTRLQLVEVRPNEPASAVMLSAEPIVINLREWLIVRYNRVTAAQNVTVWAIPSVTGAALVKWTSAGDITLYRVSGGRVVEKDTLPATGAFVDPYNTRIYDPFSRRYRWLRRIINGPFALAYYIDPGDAANSFVDLGADAAISTADGDGSSLISKVYPFEALAIENWDPRREGIGVRKTSPTVFFGRVTTRPRWHITSFNVGGDANTSLVTGISSGDTDFEVESIFGFPDPDLDADQFPFLIAIDDGLDEEQVLVVSMTGSLWHVIRGQAGTTAIIHEAGAPVRRVGVDDWDGFPWPPELLEWPEGRQWAEEELAELSKPRIDLDVHIAHFRGDQLTVDYGSMHDVDVATEGPPARWSGTGRVIGWSTDPGHSPSADDPTPAGGDTEIVLEWEQ